MSGVGLCLIDCEWIIDNCGGWKVYYDGIMN